jgi:hypothetical protein
VIWPSWTRFAACRGQADRGHDPFHPRKISGQPPDWTEARKLCAGCAVQQECQEFALALLPLAPVCGMFGGLTPAELRDLARARGLPTKPLAVHGSRARYVSGCRCAPCTLSNTLKEAQRRRNKLAPPDPLPAAPEAADVA